MVVLDEYPVVETEAVVIAATTKARVKVAIPESRWRKFRAVRSAIRMAAKSPDTSIIRSPGIARFPSSKRRVSSRSLLTVMKTPLATEMPARTSGS
jgi:hypothetical protein